MRNRRKQTSLILLVIVIDLVLLLGVMALMRHVKFLLLEDVRLNLTEVASQATDVIDSRLDLEAHILTLLARNLSESNAALRTSPERRLRSEDWQKLLEEQTGRESARYFIADLNGRANLAGHTSINVKGRKYYRRALTDGPNFSSRLILRHNGEQGIVLSVPLLHSEKAVGTLQKIYTPSQLYSMAIPSIFSSKGEINIISQEGYLLVSSEDRGKIGDFDNYFRDLYETGNRGAADRMEKDLAQYNAGFVETTEDGEERFSVYMPIDAVPGWCLVFSVAQQTVFQHATRVLNIFYAILFVLVSIFGVSLGLLLHAKRREQQRLEEVAYVDSVTGGQTYNKFMADVQDRLDSGKDHKFSILSFDIDSFKYVNSHFGFDVGDEVLRMVDRKMAAELREGETLGHLSGDRFVALLTDASPDRVREMLAPVNTENGFTLHFSGGLYEIGPQAESIKLMVDKATLASKGIKGRLDECLATYTLAMDQRQQQDEQVRQALQVAIAKGQIIPFFQPKIDIETGRLVGAEALARWRKPDGSLVSPAEFIPVSERSGLVVDIDRVIFEQVLAFLDTHLKEGAPAIPISTNFSRMHLLNRDFPQNVIDTLRASKVPAHCLDVELTESAFFTTNARMSELVQTLRRAGVSVSMDDFGSGYSSLNMLKEVPINILKIDQGFLRQTTDIKRRDIIFGAVVHMARELNIGVVVEGVETQEDVELMRRFSCRVAQGYFYSKPMPPETFSAVYCQGHL